MLNLLRKILTAPQFLVTFSKAHQRDILCYVMLCYVIYSLLAIEMSQIKMNIQTPMVGYFNPSVEGSQDVREPKSLEEFIEVGFKV